MRWLVAVLLVQVALGARHVGPWGAEAQGRGLRPTGQGARIDPLVETKLGLIRGMRSTYGPYSEFLGIPYAVVDEADPFAPSVPQGPFNETFNAYTGDVECPQMRRDGNPAGQIQCLKLNIFVPNTATTQNPLPVMVYIHGGAFIGGSGGTGMGRPDKLLDKGVVYVSINYRLGIYGFLCTDSPKAPGNIGLKDQLLALRWIKDNIASFGGNPNKVTAFGESAGAMSIHLHILSQHEKLFDGAVIQSGPATSPLTFVELDNSLPIRLAATLGFVTESVDEALDFVAKADVNLAIAAGAKLKSETIYNDEPLTKVCVEKSFEGIERFVTVNPNAATAEKAKSISVMIGVASQEMIFLHGGQQPSFFDNYPFKDLMSFGLRTDGMDAMIDQVRRFYIGDTPSSVDLVNEITSYASDFAFNHPAERAIQAMLDVGPKAVYQYMFAYKGDSDMYGHSTIHIDGVGHASDTAYLLVGGDRELSENDTQFVDMMTTMWTNFAKYGDPTPETSDVLPVKWEKVTKDTEPYLHIDKTPVLKSRMFHDRMAFWDLFYRLNERHTKWYQGD